MSQRSEHESERSADEPGATGASVKDLFAAALEAEEEGKDIESVLAGADASIREAVEGLLKAHERATGRLLDATDDTQTGWSRLGGGRFDPGPARIEAPVIAGYDIGEELGRGGFGVVYRARQRVPVDRPVAIKLLRNDFATRAVFARFRAEARVLAKMNHPGIARVLDAGLDAKSRPYLVMELVEGRPILEACDSGGLSVRERIALMAGVCEAVHHAHQRAIIHRDLKPANVLVETIDGAPSPRVIDFGIAKLLDREDGDTMTLAGDRLGTPKYMSPEQREGGDSADVRTDVYALGVVLCELLTGRVPPENEASGSGPGAGSGSGRGTGNSGTGRSGAFGQSVRPSTLALADPSTAERAKLLKGDLDRIVMKAIARYPESRYASALAMAQDLRRFLDGLPVQATAPSRVYLVRKFVGRHRAVAGIVAAAAVAVAGGVVALGYGAREARLGQIEAETALGVAKEERERAESMATFLLGNMLSAIDPDLYQGEDRSLKDTLRSTAGEATMSLTEEPEVLLKVLERVGQAQRAIGDTSGAANTLTEAAVLSTAQRGAGDAATIELRLDVLLSRLSSRQQLNYPAELAYLKRMAEENLPPEHATRYRLDIHQIHMLERDDRTVHAREVEGRIGASEHAGTAVHFEAMRYLASALLEREPEVSLELSSRALEDAVTRYGQRHSQTIEVRFTFAEALDRVGRSDEAEREYRLLLDHAAVVGGTQSVYFQTAMSKVIEALRDRGEIDHALEMAYRQRDLASEHFGERSSQYAGVMRRIATCHGAAGEWDEASEAFEVSLVSYFRFDKAQMIEALKTRVAYAAMLRDAERWDRVPPVLGLVFDTLQAGHEVRVNAAVLRAESMDRLVGREEAVAFVQAEIVAGEAETGQPPRALLIWLEEHAE